MMDANLPGGKKSGIQISDLLAKETNTVGDSVAIGLHDAAEKGLTKVIEKIFDRTMDLNIDMRDRFDRTALHWAAECGHRETCCMLLELGADVRATESLGRTCIHLAARSGHVNVIKAILDKLEDDGLEDVETLINQDDNNGITALFLGRQRGDDGGMEVFELLLRKGAHYDLNRWPAVHSTPPAENLMGTKN
eukprot:CAMPEP_0117668242 /NCGR_PEP_ID=MMETSP0804-20121206/11436_1 /TAXON_ID=1074897 /ORGANISM="Tetraselmis astigmatica, Strain CCMP880" /LENGTH=192 /DNA_ID=CAMNT_0005476103 /DNA_START=374 /DNA_END=952 /DNA_ORIENTATION=+